MNLSVIIPVAPGRQRNLYNTLYALSAQTYSGRWEVILVSDSLEEDFSQLLKRFRGLDLKLITSKPFEPGKDSPPRNKGAKLALADSLIFLDSDVILDKDALKYYAEDFEANPQRVVAGLYDWLPPCQIDEELIEAGLDSIRGYDGEHLRLKIPQLEWPDYEYRLVGGKRVSVPVQTHNACRDLRWQMFAATNPDTVFTGPGNMNCYLGAFSGNIGYSATTFWRAGGFWPDITAGIVDDGALGLTLWHKSVAWIEVDDQQVMQMDETGQPVIRPEFGISFDQRIKGVHQYHGRNVQRVQAISAKEVDLIDRRFRLNRYAGGEVKIPQNVTDASAIFLHAMGVDRWKKEW